MAGREPENLDMCQTLKCEKLTKTTGLCKFLKCTVNPKRASHYRAMQAQQEGK